MPYFGQDVVIPDKSLHELVWEKLQKHGNRTAIIDTFRDGQSITYSEIHEFSRTCAAYLQSQGINKGDYVSICSSGNIEFAYLLIGILGSGATVAPCNPSYRKNEILQQFAISRPRIVFVDEAKEKMMKSVKEEISHIEQIIVIGKSSEFLTVGQILSDTDPGVLRYVDVHPINDVALVPHTSGTTGFPKCAIVTHNDFIGRVTVGSFAQTEPSDIGYCDRPMYHAAGYGFVVASLLTGAKVIAEREFNIENFFKLITKHSVTTVISIPPMLIEMANASNVENYDLSSLKLIIAGGAAIPSNVIQQIIKKFNVKILTEYGMTETGSIAMGMVNSGDKSPSSGKVQKGVTLKITNIFTGEECQNGSDGEIQVKSPQVTKGYLKNPSANATAFSHDGWFRTGDFGHLDEDGNLYVVDRLKEIIKYKSLQVSPAELESVIISHPKVYDVGVIGIPDEKSGEVPKAFVVSSDPTLTVEDIHQIVNDNLVEYKHLRGGVEIVSSIPKSKLGKIQRNVLKQMAGLC